MNWIIFQIIAGLGVVAAHAASKFYGGLNLISYLIFIGLSIGIIGWAVPKSYESAPSFFQAFFIGTAVIAFFAFITSFLIFHEAVSIYNIIGSIGIIICSILLVL